MAQLEKRKTILNPEKELVLAKRLLEKSELVALSLQEELENEYQFKFNEMFKHLKARKTYKEYKVLKKEFDICAKPELRQTTNKTKVLTKRYTTVAQKSVSGLVRVAETSAEDVKECVKELKMLRKTFRLSTANYLTMFKTLVEYEKLRVRLTGVVFVIQEANKSQEKHYQDLQRNKYLNNQEKNEK